VIHPRDTPHIKKVQTQDSSRYSKADLCPLNRCTPSFPVSPTNDCAALVIEASKTPSAPATLCRVRSFRTIAVMPHIKVEPQEWLHYSKADRPLDRCLRSFPVCPTNNCAALAIEASKSYTPPRQPCAILMIDAMLHVKDSWAPRPHPECRRPSS
jgi:hypothetical protein